MKRFLKLFFRSIRRGGEIAGFIFCKLVFGCRSSSSGGLTVIIQDQMQDVFAQNLSVWRSSEMLCCKPLVLVCDLSNAGLAESSGMFDRIIAVDFRKADRFYNCFYRWQILLQLRKLHAGKAVQALVSGKTYFSDCMLLAIRSPQKYVLVDCIYNVRYSGVFYEALRTKFFMHTMPYRIELEVEENIRNFAGFCSNKP